MPVPVAFKGVKRSGPAEVHKNVSLAMGAYLSKTFENCRPAAQRPAWFDVMTSIPPAEHTVRPIAQQLRQPNDKARKPRNLYKPQKIKYKEDRLRKEFFRDHPWELATPRSIVERDGRDWTRVDWSKGLQQPGMPLTGESVVQRQLYLMESEKLSKSAAYDITRREFYRLRQQEEVERRIALEEAKYVGAYFGPSRLDIGMHIEDAEFEKWKAWAKKTGDYERALTNKDIETFGREEEEEDYDMDATAGEEEFSRAST